MTKKIGDLLSLGLILISIFIINISFFNTSNLFRIIGFIGALIVLIVESYFLIQTIK